MIDSLTKLIGIFGAFAFLALVAGYSTWEGYLGAFNCGWVASHLPRTLWVKAGWELIKSATVPATVLVVILAIVTPRRLLSSPEFLKHVIAYLATFITIFLAVVSIPIFSSILNNKWVSLVFLLTYYIFLTLVLIIGIAKIIHHSAFSTIETSSTTPVPKELTTFGTILAAVIIGAAVLIFGLEKAAHVRGEFLAAENLRTNRFSRVTFATDKPTSTTEGLLLVSSGSHHYVLTKGTYYSDGHFSGSLYTECVQVPFDKIIKISNQKEVVSEAVNIGYRDMDIRDVITSKTH